MTLLAYLDVVLTVLPRYLRLALIGRVQAGLVRSAITALIAKRGGANTIRPLARAILSGMLHSAEQIVSFAIWTRARSLSGLATWRIPLPPIYDASTAPGIAVLLNRLAALHHRLDMLDVHARRLAAKWKHAAALPAATSPLRLDAAHRSTSPDCVGGGNHTPQPFSSPARSVGEVAGARERARRWGQAHAQATGPPTPNSLLPIPTTRAWLTHHQRGRGRLCCSSHASRQLIRLRQILRRVDIEERIGRTPLPAAARRRTHFCSQPVQRSFP
jgi:hypothetical protein